MKKVILLLVLLNSFYVFADIIVHGEQNAGKGGNSVFGKPGKDGDVFVVYNNQKISLTQCAKKYNFKLKNYTITDEYIFVDNRKIAVKDCIDNISTVN